MSLLRTMLGNRALLRVELSWATAALGNWTFSILLALYAYAEGGTSAVAVALLVRMLPAGLAAPYAAMLADRHSRRTVLLWSAALRAAALLGAARPPRRARRSASSSRSRRCSPREHRAPAGAGGVTPQLARTPAELAAANVCWSTLEYAGFLAGSLAAGLIATLLPLDVGFAACAAALALTWLVLWPLPRDRRPAWIEEASAGPGRRAARGRAQRVGAHRAPPAGRGLRDHALVQGIIDVLIVVASFELLDLGEGGAGWLNAAWGVGGVAGGAASLALLGRGRLASGLSFGLALAGICFLLVGALVVGGAGLPAARGDGRRLRAGRVGAADAAAAARGRRRPRARVRRRGVARGRDARGRLGGRRGARRAARDRGRGDRRRRAAAARRARDRAAARRARSPARRCPSGRSRSSARSRSSRRCRSRCSRRSRCGCGSAGSRPATASSPRARRARRSSSSRRERSRWRVDEVPRRELGAGDFFGEIALLHDVPRTATVTAVGAVDTLVVDREQFLDSIGSHARSTTVAETVASDRMAADARAAA